MKVTVIDTKTGQEKTMAPRFANILTRIGRAQYLTRDMVAAGTAAADDSADKGDTDAGEGAAAEADSKPKGKPGRKPAAKKDES